MKIYQIVMRPTDGGYLRGVRFKSSDRGQAIPPPTSARAHTPITRIRPLRVLSAKPSTVPPVHQRQTDRQPDPGMDALSQHPPPPPTQGQAPQPRTDPPRFQRTGRFFPEAAGSSFGGAALQARSIRRTADIPAELARISHQHEGRRTDPGPASIDWQTAGDCGSVLPPRGIDWETVLSPGVRLGTIPPPIAGARNGCGRRTRKGMR